MRMFYLGERIHRKGLFTFLVSCLGLIIAMQPFQARAQDNPISKTPLYNALENYSGAVKNTVKREERQKFCLLGMKTYDYAANHLGTVKPDSAKAIRARKTAPILQAYLYENMQTKANYDQAIQEVKTEFSYFKNANKKEQKRLVRIAKKKNKICGKRIENIKISSIGKYRKIAELIPQMSSKTAELCYAVTLQSSSAATIGELLNVGEQMVTWKRVYVKEKRREGVSDNELVEPFNSDDAKKALEDIDKQTALRLYDECPAKYKKAKFEQKLEKVDENAKPVSWVDWN